MMNLMRSGYSRAGLAVLALTVAGCSSDAPQWASVNQSVIDQAKVTGRTRELPAVSVPMVLGDGEPVEAAKLPTVTIAPGVSAKLAWGRGALLERVEMQADAVYPEQTLGEELIIIGQDGSATVEFDGKTAELKKDQALYLQPGAKRSVKAGSKGWKAFEVYSPVRLDHLALAGQNTSGVNATFPDQGVTPSLQPGVVVNLSEIPWTPLTDPGRGQVLSAGCGAVATPLGQERADQSGPHGSRLRVPTAHSSRRSIDAHGPGDARSGRDGQVIRILRGGGKHDLPAERHGALGQTRRYGRRPTRCLLASAARLS